MTQWRLLRVGATERPGQPVMQPASDLESVPEFSSLRSAVTSPTRARGLARLQSLRLRDRVPAPAEPSAPAEPGPAVAGADAAVWPRARAKPEVRNGRRGWSDCDSSNCTAQHRGAGAVP
jgi:hypothetical protein